MSLLVGFLLVIGKPRYLSKLGLALILMVLEICLLIFVEQLVRKRNLDFWLLIF